MSRSETDQMSNWFYYKMQDVCISWTQLVPETDHFKKRESTIHLKQGPDFHSKKCNFILENKNIGTIESKIYGEKSYFTLSLTKYVLDASTGKV